MNIYITHSTSFDFHTELYKPLKNSIIAKNNNIFFPHDEENKNINSQQIIKNSDLIIAEVSYPSTGQGIELGWANSLNKNILCIYKKNQKFSSSLKFITDNFIEYENTEDLINKLSNIL
jgi:nucleoside 2-deoxyribosyltransferase